MFGFNSSIKVGDWVTSTSAGYGKVVKKENDRLLIKRYHIFNDDPRLNGFGGNMWILESTCRKSNAPK